MKVMQLPLGLQLQDDATFHSFYEAQNAPVVAAIHQLLAQSALDPYLYIWGESGVGCTHLLQAACHEMTGMGQSACYLPLSYRTHQLSDMLDGLEHLQLVCLDDIEAIAGQARAEEALFHFFNRARALHTRLIIAGNAAPRVLPIQLPDLKSRLSWGLSFQVHPLSDEEKLAALQLRAKARGLVLNDEVGRFLLRRCDRGMQGLYQTLAELDAASLSAQRRLTIPFVKEVLAV